MKVKKTKVPLDQFPDCCFVCKFMEYRNGGDMCCFHPDIEWEAWDGFCKENEVCEKIERKIV